MSDIVERLRESVRACRALDRSMLLEEAAVEIERLRCFTSYYVRRASYFEAGVEIMSTGSLPDTVEAAKRLLDGAGEDRVLGR